MKTWAIVVAVMAITIAIMGAALPPPSSPPTLVCSADNYDRGEWGRYPAVDPTATARWTVAADNVNAPNLTQDHHVALKDAHTSGGCNWSAAEKDEFSDDPGNLNPTTKLFNSSKGSRTPDRLTGIAASIINTDADI